MNSTSIFLFLIFTLAVMTVEAAEGNCQPLTGDIEGMPIGEIIILNNNIFDEQKPDENSTIHKIGNKLHIKTRTSVIRAQLLFEKGQPYRQQQVDESERILRERKFIHSARIYAQNICNEKVVVVVKTSDNWTLTPSISLGRSGGINRTSYEISESNLLGFGKQIILKSSSDEDRDTRFIAYNDMNLFGTHNQLKLKVAHNSDGFLDSLSVGEPFYQLDSRTSLLLNLHREEKQTASYDKGKIVAITGQSIENYSIEKGWSAGLQDNSVIRYKLGWNSSSREYFKVATYPATLLPEDMLSNYPYLGLEYLENRYIKRENFNVMGVIEDIPVGSHFSISAGLLSQSFGSTHDGYVINTNYSLGLDINQNTLAFLETGISSSVFRDAQDYNAASLKASWMQYRDNNHSYFVKAEYRVADNLLSTDKYVIGGDTGLSGYPIRYQTGTSKALLSAEKRIYFDWYPWKIVKFGMAFFADVGAAWESGESPDYLRDVGWGIRLVSTRQSDSKVLHLDFAYPLDELDQVDNFQVLLKASSRF